MHSSLVRKFVFRGRQAEISRRSMIYKAGLDRKEIERHQVAAFNNTWRYCLESVPFYRAWASEHSLPHRITDVVEIAGFPVLTKQVLVERTAEVFQNDAIVDAYSTGGTTGTPTRFPRHEGDTLPRYADVYAAREWWGLKPFDSYVHLWGHSHLFGGSKMLQAKRWLTDVAVNAKRLDAYTMTDEAMESHYREIVRRDPVYLVGYTSALFKLARYIETERVRIGGLSRLKAVILTAETVSPADVELISRVFGTQVIVEYGAAETGALAVSRDETWPLQVLWASFAMHVGPSGDINVTTLNDRLFPLINYAMGDRAVPGDVKRGNALTLRAVLGREKDVVQLGTLEGKSLVLSAILPVHILKSEPWITAVQFRQTPSALTIYVTASKPLDVSALHDRFTRELRRDHPSFDATTVVFEQVPAPLITRAGKQALFVD